MSTDAQIEANRRNSLRSTGPKTDSGKRKASQNAYKHGLRADRDRVMREQTLAFEARMQRWSAPDGADDMHEFLLHDNVSLSFEIERVERSLVERRRRKAENAESDELAQVHDLGCRLYHDRTGPIATYGTRRWDPKKKRVSWQEDAVHPDRPAVIVNTLRSSANGCVWLLEQWDALKERLCSGPGFWVASDKFKAVRLLGREPIDAMDDRRVADVFAAAHSLFGAGKPFDNLISDMSQGALESFERRVNNLYPDLVGHDDPKRAKQILIDLVDENIAELEEKLAEHNENGWTKAQRDDDYNGFDDSRAGQALNGQLARCRRLLDRGRSAFLKHREKKDGGRGPEGGGKTLAAGDFGARNGRGSDLGLDGGADGARSVAATGSGAGDCVRISDSDVLVCGGFLPERIVARAPDATTLEVASSKSETLGGSGTALVAKILDDLAADEMTSGEQGVDALEVGGEPLAAGHDEGPDAGAGDDLTSAHEDTDGRNFTNEANLDDHVKISQTCESIGVVADSGDGSGLDNLRTDPNLGDPLPPGPGDHDVEGLSGALQPLSPGSAEDLLEIERTLFKEIERLKADGAPVDDLLKDVLTVSAEFHAFLEQQDPRAP